MPSAELFEAMGKYNEELVNAGIMLAGEGLQPSAKGKRVAFEGSKRTVIDGPFAETKELIAGYTLIRAATREEALQWSKRFPAPMGEFEDGEIEVRQLYELEDFADVPEQVERFRDMGVGGS
jgi:hypothetical protein